MQRRDVLKGGAFMAMGAGALEGCATVRPPVEPGVMPPDMDVFLNDVDARMHTMDSATFVEGFAVKVGKRPLSDVERARIRPKDKLFRGMLRTLYLTQTFRDLPEEGQMHPGVQERMFRHIGEVNETVTGVTEHLAKLGAEERSKVQEYLRKDPDLGMTIAESIDDQAAIAGVSGKRRLQLRAMMTQASFRLKHSSADAVIDEYLDKAHRMTAQSGVQADLALRIEGRVGSDIFWQQHPGYGAAPSSNDASGGGTAPSPAIAPSPSAAPQTPASSEAGMGAVRTGAWLMGIGVVVFGVGGVIVAAGAFPGVFGMTVGAILFAVGLVTLIVGALIHASSKPE